jgi:CheY-like chemotaxis protein
MEMLESSSASVIVSDIAMPGEDGYSFMQRVRARNLPAVALTAYARPEDRQRALDAGFREHVAKPVDPHHLIDVVAVLAQA